MEKKGLNFLLMALGVISFIFILFLSSNVIKVTAELFPVFLFFMVVASGIFAFGAINFIKIPLWIKIILTIFLAIGLVWLFFVLGIIYGSV